MRRQTLCVIAFALSVASANAQQVRLPVGDARVTGRVVAADTGTPLAGAAVVLHGLNTPEDLAYRTVTDASGVFDFQNVWPREYRVRASKAGFFAKPTRTPNNSGEVVVVREGETASGVTVGLRRGGVITGRLVDQFGEPVDRIRVHARRLQYRPNGERGVIGLDVVDFTDDRGEFRLFELEPADYLVVATGRHVDGVSIERTSLPIADTSPTYYPGTTNYSVAQSISVRDGEHVSIQFAASEQRPVTVAGTVHMSNGRPATGMQVGLESADGAETYGRYGGEVSASGTFSLSRVTPGNYLLHVFLWQPLDLSGRTRGEHALVPLTVGVADVGGLSVVTRPGATVTGTVVFEGSAKRQGLVVTASALDMRVGSLPVQSEPIGEDGRFSLFGVAERAYLSASPGWTITSVIVDGSEIGDAPLDTGGRSQVSSVQVTLTDQLTQVAGTVIDDRRRPLAEHDVVLLRVDGPSSLPLTRRVRRLVTDERGAFSVRGLYPGEYVVGAVEYLDMGDQFAPDFLGRLREQGRRFSLEVGDAVTLEVRPLAAP